MPVLALGLFAGGAAVSGYLGAANSVGAVVGSFAALLFVAYRAKGMLVLYASLAYAIFLFAFGLAESLWFGLIMIALLGAADAVTVAVRHTTVTASAALKSAIMIKPNHKLSAEPKAKRKIAYAREA